MYADISKHANTHLILTATRRLALRLQEGFHAHLKIGQAREAAQIYALNDWFHHAWHVFQIKGLTGSTHPLSPLQEHAIWLNVVYEQCGESLLKPYHTAKQLANTWKLLHQWRLNRSSIDWGLNDESQMFESCAQRFLQKIEPIGFTSVEYPDRILALCESSNFDTLSSYNPEHRILLVGFDDLPPQFRHFFDVLSSQGWQVERHQRSSSALQSVHYRYQDFTQELEGTAIKAFEAVKNDSALVGIVVPDLVKCRSEVITAFDKVLQPETAINPVDQVRDHYNISAGLSLIEYPIVNALFISLNLLETSFDGSSLFYMLQSPFFKGALNEQTGRAYLQKSLNESRREQWGLSNLIALSYQIHAEHDLTHWLASLETLKEFKDRFEQTQSMLTWQGFLKQWMQVWDWPGERALTSPEHQVVQRFFGLVNEWGQLDHVTTGMSGKEAFRWLKRLAQETTFQPEAKQVKIHVMGLLEASGQDFDALFITGLHAQALPSPPNPDPFIPLDIQRQHQMPHATAQREFEYAQHLIESFLSSAQKVVFSHYANFDGRTFHPSPLIPMSYEEHPSLDQFNHALYENFDQTLTEFRSEDMPWPVQDHEEIRGGTGIIQSQSICPFQAFGTYRLRLSPPEGPQKGIDARLRGIIIHEALEKFWNTTKSHQNLCARSEESIEKQLKSIVDDLEPHIEQAGISKIYWTVEKQRMIALLKSWLSLEKTREPFKVLKTECWTKIVLGPLTLNCRLDRVDLDENHNPIILDYKTGKTSLAACLGERPHAPQLPLYCFADFPPNPKGVVFAQVHRDGCRFVGISDIDKIIPGVKTPEDLKDALIKDWDSLKTLWHQTLKGLAQAFNSGHCEVDPIAASDCDRCHLPSVCRVFEKTV